MAERLVRRMNSRNVSIDETPTQPRSFSDAAMLAMHSGYSSRRQSEMILDPTKISCFLHCAKRDFWAVDRNLTVFTMHLTEVTPTTLRTE
uniref:Uncharacterized protein n=1 Tax=Bursaphelenchus xylophilus TaxID=6326 RepID=A0A1I7S6A8_BURXY